MSQESLPSGAQRSAPAALRNRGLIADELARWLPDRGSVLEVASGTGEHVLHFSERFDTLSWQPSDPSPEARASIDAWTHDRPNVRPAIEVDASAAVWPVERVDAIVNINMIHISPWEACLGLLTGAARLLSAGQPLCLYGPYVREGVATAPSNVAFDESLRARNPTWGVRGLEEVVAAAAQAGLDHHETVEMPANNLCVLLRRRA